MNCLLLAGVPLLVVNTPGEPYLFPAGEKSLKALTRFLRPWDEEKESREKELLNRIL
jgi:hypothetical protein